MLPLRKADLRRVKAVFTDVDGTLTTGGQLHSSTLKSIEALVERGLRVVLVSGRPAGWGECWARQLPVSGVIVENGGLYFAKRPGCLTLKKVYAEKSERTRLEQRTRLTREVNAAIKAVKGAKLSMDSAATEVDLAIDYAEEASLGPDAAQALEDFLRARGITAVRSSVHVNCWAGQFDKRSMVEAFIAGEMGQSLKRKGDPRFIYVGDSYNDEPMFRAFSLSIGVANVLDVLDRLEYPPQFVTRAREGAGFREVARAVLGAQQPS